MADSPAFQSDTLATLPADIKPASYEIGGEQHQRVVVGQIANPSATLTRPADTTAYAVDDLLANSATAGSVTPLSWTVARINDAASAVLGVVIPRIRIFSATTTGLGGVGLRVYLFTASPTVSNGDNGAFSVASNLNTCIGAFDVVLEAIASGGAIGFGLPTVGPYVAVAPPTVTLYGLIRVLSAFTPASGGQFTVTLDVMRD